MSTTETHHALWVAYGPSGVVGSIRKDDDGYTVTMAGADASAGRYTSMEIAKNALHSRMIPGSDLPEFREHGSAAISPRPARPATGRGVVAPCRASAAQRGRAVR